MQTDELRPGPQRRRAFAFPGAYDVTPAEIAAQLDELAERIARIRPMSHRNPHAFYEDRSEVAHAARELAKQIRDFR